MDIPFAVAGWVVGFLVGQSLGIVVYAVAGVEEADRASITTVFSAVFATWVAYLAGAWWASKQSGSGDFVADYRLRVAASDLVGLPIGVLTQLVVLPLVYLPLTEIWPDTFSDDKLTENAQSLVDRADGLEVALLVLLVCVGAPLVEEIVYRGMLQGSFMARFDHKLALVLVSVWFALIHFRPVEYPGLLVTALVFGACFVVTGRLGTAIAAHVAFNATGLALVAW